MNKIEQKHLEAIEDTLTNKSNKILATSCAEITKEYAEKFDKWKHENRVHYLKELRQYVKYSIDGDMVMNFDYLCELFINDLNEKP